MTERVTRRAFKNGGSWAIRIPKGWIPADAEVDLIVREDGVLEIRPLDSDQRIRKLLARLAEQPELSESELPVPSREVEAGRFDFNEMFRD